MDENAKEVHYESKPKVLCQTSNKKEIKINTRKIYR